MEAIHSGWLVKSPTDRPWKILKPKWKKRYFVLCTSQASAALPGHCPAVLDYYEDDRQLHKRGTIDLSSCDEVQTNITSPPYEHVFNLRTKHKDRSRTYLFSAETEADMHRWVRFLCNVLHLTDRGPEASDANAVSSATDDRYVRVPQVVSAPSLPPSSASHGSSPHATPVLSDAPSTLTDKDKAEAYICLDECYSGRSPNSQKANGHLAPKFQARHSPPKADNSRFDQRRIEYANVPRSGSGDCDFTDGLAGPRPNSAAFGSRNVFPSSSRVVSSAGAAAAGKKPDSNGAEASSNRDPELPSYLNLGAVGCLTQDAATVNVYMNAAMGPSGSKSPSSSPASRAVSNGSPPGQGQGQGQGQKAANTFSTSRVGNGHLSSSTVSVEGKIHSDNPGITDVIEEPVLISGRTQSFKRNIIHTDVQLPIKKSNQGLDTSSSDGDTSDEDNNPPHRCYENEAVSSQPPPPLPPPPKKLGHGHARPNNPVQYLDLNLEESSGAEKSPMINRSQHLPPPETDYNEIDWVKTKALLETKKDLESERRSSEKSAE